MVEWWVSTAILYVVKICNKCGKEGEFYAGWNSCKVCVRERERERYAADPEKKLRANREYVASHSDRMLTLWRNNERKRRPQRRLTANLRSRLSHAVVRRSKAGSAVRDLGCSVPELRLYLESKFQPGMSWDNYGAWHIDHIKPLAKFDLADRDQLLEACHYSNLQPLWAGDNLSKGAR
jgi:hypothetical protein